MTPKNGLGPDHDKFAVEIDEDTDEIVVSICNFDTYDSARVRLDVDEAEERGYEIIEAADELTDDSTGTSKSRPPGPTRQQIR